MPCPVKFAAILEHWKNHFASTILVKLENQNFRVKGPFCKGLFEIFQILEYNFLYEHFQKSISNGAFNSIVSCGM